MKTLAIIFWRVLFKIIIKTTTMKLWRKVSCNVEGFLPPFWLITYLADRTEQLLPANNRVLKLVANLNVINESVLFRSCHISLLISIHFACTRSFYLVVLTQFCYFKITPIYKLVVTGNIWKNRKLPAKCDANPWLLELTRMDFSVSKIRLPLWTWDFRKALLRIPFAMGVSVHMKLK